MKRLLTLLFIVFATECLAQPSTGYATATPDAPSNDGETGFTFIVDLSDMPTSWWSTAENTDATRGRVYRNDGTTELACDWIDYSDATETGFVRFKDDMAASPTTYRIYPPVSGNATVAASATYGSDNAYDANWLGYYTDAASTDRTSNGADLTGTSITAGDATGQIGDATSYAGSPDRADQTASVNADEPFTLMAWIKPTANNVPLSAGNQSTSSYHAITMNSNNLRATTFDGTSTGNAGATLDVVTDGNWHHGAAVFSADDKRSIIVDGTTKGTNTTSLTVTGIDRLTVGVTGDSTPASYFSGDIDEVQYHGVARSDEWIGEEYLQTNDNSAYWNGWTWNAGSGSSIAPLIHYYRQQMGQ